MTRSLWSLAFRVNLRNERVQPCPQSPIRNFVPRLPPRRPRPAESAPAGGIAGAIRGVALQLLLPFALGQLLHPWLVGWVTRWRTLLSVIDRGSILLVVYVAFSAAVVRGLWQAVSAGELGVLVVVDGILLAVVIGLTRSTSRLAGLARADEIVVVFCGSKKSLATGVPIAGLLFPEALAGKVLLPLMVFHQMQLLVMAVIAQRWARREVGVSSAPCRVSSSSST